MSECSTSREHYRQPLGSRIAFIAATPALCVTAVAAALIDLRATAAILLGTAVLTETVLSLLHHARPRLRTERSAPGPASPRPDRRAL